MRHTLEHGFGRQECLHSAMRDRQECLPHRGAIRFLLSDYRVSARIPVRGQKAGFLLFRAVTDGDLVYLWDLRQALQG